MTCLKACDGHKIEKYMMAKIRTVGSFFFFLSHETDIDSEVTQDFRVKGQTTGTVQAQWKGVQVTHPSQDLVDSPIEDEDRMANK